MAELRLKIDAVPGTPPANTVTEYAKADKNLYYKDDAGTETQIGGVFGATGAPTNAQYVTLVANTGLSAERVLTSGSGTNVRDGTTAVFIDADYGTAVQPAASGSSAGSSLKLAREDHYHAVPVDGSLTWSGSLLGLTSGCGISYGTYPMNISSASASGSASTVMRSDHVHALPTDNTCKFVSGNLSVGIVGETKYVNTTTGNDSTGDGSSGSPWKTIAKGVTYFQGKLLVGANVLDIADGTYSEAVNLSSITVGGGGSLTLLGDNRAVVGLSYIDSAYVNEEAVAGLGSGTVSLSRGGAGNTVLTVAGSGASPDFAALGVQSNDKVLVYDAAGSITEVTLTGVSGNTLTQASAWPANIANDGSAIVIEPRVIITGSGAPQFAATNVDGLTLDGLTVVQTNSANICISLTGCERFIQYRTLAYGGNTGVYASRCRLAATLGSPGSVWGQAAFGFYFIQSYGSLLYASAVKSTNGFFLSAANMNLSNCKSTYNAYGVYADKGTSVDCAGGASRVHSTIGFAAIGNSFVSALTTGNKTTGAAYANKFIPVPGSSGAYAESASNFGVLTASD